MQSIGDAGAVEDSRTFKGFVRETRTLIEQLDDCNIDVSTFLERCTRLTNAAIGCSRTGIWLFVDTDHGLVLRCMAMFDATVDRMVPVPPEWRDVQPYFDALENDAFLSTSDASQHPAIAGTIAERLLESGVRPLLATMSAPAEL